MAVVASSVDDRLYEYNKGQVFTALRRHTTLPEVLYPVIGEYMGEYVGFTPKPPIRDLFNIFFQNAIPTAVPVLLGGLIFGVESQIYERLWINNQLDKAQMECARTDTIYKQLFTNWEGCLGECKQNVTHLMGSMHGPWSRETRELYRREAVDNCMSHSPFPSCSQDKICYPIRQYQWEDAALLLDPMPQPIAPILGGIVEGVCIALLFPDLRRRSLNGWMCGGAFGCVTLLASGSLPIAIATIGAVGAVVSGGVAVGKYIYGE